MVTPNRKSAFLAALSLAAAVNVLPLVAAAIAQETPRAAKAEPPPDDKRWQAVAPGRIEPKSGEIKISAPVIGIIDEVLVKANDKVFAGEPLIRLVDTDAQARKATAEAQASRAQRRAARSRACSARRSPSRGSRRGCRTRAPSASTAHGSGDRQPDRSRR